MLRVNRLALCCSAVLAALLLCSQALAQSQPRRLALVIGNDKYQYVAQLKKAVNDATAMERELRATGFAVTKHLNLTDRAQEQAVSQFSKTIRGGDEVIVFFAGHGVQIKSGSYLLPVDIQVGSEREIEKFALGLQDMMDMMSAARPGFALFIVDACRDNPLKTAGRSVGIERGLIPAEPAKGQIVVYSAGKGQSALDRLSDADSDPNGVFTREFIKRMHRPGTGIRELIEEVQDSVERLARTVGHEQRPAVYSEARGNFYFLGPVTVQSKQGTSAAPAGVPGTQEEAFFWNESKAVGSVDGYQAYLDQYPNGKFAGIARAYIKQLRQSSGAASAGAADPKAAPPKAAPPPQRDTATASAPARSLAEIVTAQSVGLADVPTDKTRSGLPYVAGPVTVKIRKVAQGKQLEQLFDAYRKDAEAGDPVAQASLGNFYNNGVGAETRPDIAVAWFRKAADQGYGRGQSNLGRMYAGGRGVGKDLKEAARWYRQSADKGHAEGQVLLGLMIAEGLGGLAKDEVEAVKWYRKSAEQGHSFGQNQLGYMYREGRGIARNDVEAAAWFRKSAMQGNAAGQSNLGYMYNNGRGVVSDYEEAIKWFRKSAEQGNPQGKSNLGFMYENGRGIAKNEAEARGWYRQAADQGDEFAKSRLAAMGKK